MATPDDGLNLLILKDSKVTNSYFLVIISIHQEKRFQELKWSLKGKCIDLLWNFLKEFFKEMYEDQSGECLCRYWGLKG